VTCSRRNILKNVRVKKQQRNIIINLEKARRLAHPDFETIVLEPEAVRILVHLFIHPGCKSDINLATFATGVPVPLSAISPHIITAFPSQVASFAQRTGITEISAAHLLECFALDHADAVEENAELIGMPPAYALAHVLTTGTVTHAQRVGQRQLVELEVVLAGGAVHFSHVLVPPGLQAAKEQTVFHHFGVVVAAAGSERLKTFARRLAREQQRKSFIQKTMKQVLGSRQPIDYAKESFFKTDMAGKILGQSERDFNFQKLWTDEDLKGVIAPLQKKDTVLFSS